MNQNPTETQVLKTILEWLAYKKILCWRNQSGMLIVGDKKKYAVKMGAKGTSDIVGCLPPDGRMLCIEIKRDKKSKVSPEQKVFIDKINSLGGLAFVATSVEEVERELGI